MFTSDDLKAVDPAQFAAAVAATPDAALAEGMSGPIRSQVLDEIFNRMEEHFDPERSKDLDLVIHFALTGAADGGSDSYQVTIRDDACKVAKELTETPEITITLDAVDYLKLATDNAKAMDLYLNGKLKVDGNLIIATRLQGLYTLPKAATAA
jgi:putative sterol carrier protein